MPSAKLAAIAFLAACGDNLAPPDAPVSRAEVALVPTAPTDAVDVLFVIQDFPSILDKQTLLKNAMSRFVDDLSGAPGGLPSLHVGVISMDLGTSTENDSQPAPKVGSGPGSCAGTGKSGNLQTNGSPLVNGNFIIDQPNSDGSRTTNVANGTTLAGAFAAIASLGASGCGFEQPLRAIRMALDNNAANTDFLRESAALVLVLLAEDEECSVASAQLFGPTSPELGPLSSFRCTRFGVTCDVGGATPDEMNTVGEKSLCHVNAASSLMMPVDVYTSFIAGLKREPRSILFSTITGPQEPFAIGLRTQPGGGASTPAMEHACSYQGLNGTEVADPGVRFAEAASAFRRHTFQSACGPDYVVGVTAIARQVRSMVGDTCLSSDIALPADCEVFDELLDGTLISIPPCSDTHANGCYTLEADASCTTTQQLLVDVKRVDPPRPDTMVSVRCRL